ncbi:MAG: glutamate synthase large chain, partial [Frankiaceae bacterium]|nr:glutamate synthase large chain [Frankiaceae bacterium]
MVSTPTPQGLYDGRHEHDACGVAFVADMTGRASHEIVRQGVLALDNLEHRGASGSEANTGDGAGILIQIPDGFLRAVSGLTLPPAGSYAAGMAFLPDDDELAAAAVQAVEALALSEGLTVLGWREVPVNAAIVGASARAVMPRFRLVFVAATGAPVTGMTLERMAFCLRKRAEREAGVYFSSLSARTLVYKGMLTAPQLDEFFPDLADERMTSALALVHSRFSTNTFPSWPLAHPYRYIAHNGEINTVKGNRNWMAAREALLASDLIPGELKRLFPIVTAGASDSASFDEVLEILHLGGRALPHAVLMMIPEAYENHAEMDPARRAFYEFHSSLMEPWDGPACVTFTDGTVIGAVLDRNGLRPGRFWVTEDGIVILASEAGVLPIDQSTIVRKGRLQPGRMLLVDLERHRIIEDDEVKSELAAANPYAEWLAANLVSIDDLPARHREPATHDSVLKLQQTFGYTEEELRTLISPMARAGAEAIGSMGTDTPIAVLSDRPRVLFDYFQQLFAQVTNPPLDAIREELVTSLRATIGPEGNLLDTNPAACRQITLPFPVLSDDELATLVHVNDDGNFPEFAAVCVRGLFPIAGGADALRHALDEVRRTVSEAIANGARLIVLSDRGSDATLAPIPSLLLTS